MPTLTRVSLATALLLSVPFAPAAALPVTLRIADDAWRHEAARSKNVIDVVHVENRIVPRLTDDRRIPDVVLPRVNPVDDRLRRPASNERAEAPAPMPVPEPAALALVALGAVVGLRRRFGRR